MVLGLGHVFKVQPATGPPVGGSSLRSLCLAHLCSGRKKGCVLQEISVTRKWAGTAFIPTTLHTAPVRAWPASFTPTGTLRTREGQPGGYRTQPHPATMNFMDSTGAPTAKGGHQEMTGHPSKDVRLMVLCETDTQR